MTDYNARMLTLTERAKELECLYAVNEILQNKQLSLPAAMQQLVQIIPAGFSDPDACRAQIILENKLYDTHDFDKVQILHVTPIVIEDEKVGEIAVGYISSSDKAPELLQDEIRLLDVIADRISQMALSTQRELTILLDMLQRINPDMLQRIGEKFRVHLKKIAGNDAIVLLDEIESETQQTYGETNTPLKKQAGIDSTQLSKKLVEGAIAFLPRGDIYNLISGWVQEERIFALVKTVDNKDASISDVLDAVNKYTAAISESQPGSTLTEAWLTAELAHRFLTGDNQLLNLVLDNLFISDFAPMIEKIIGSNTSRGNIGGKGAGIFIAKQILQHAALNDPLLEDIKTPRTWYVATDQIVDFLQYNNMKEMNAYKYNSTFHLRMTYDDVVSKIKNSKLPPHTVHMLSIVLDDMEGTPIIVRSSSLLEDSHHGAFSGKYKSLFLANQGSKQKRLEELIDAILEVYSSMYNPDSIEYRKERGLLNSTEQMGILIQEVVGHRIGKYFMPDFAGVAFSHNLLRWSARITREGGLVRMVMGLGTRAVDRVNDDYPVLFSPTTPDLRINQSPTDIRYYSPKHIDLINTETGEFETVDVASFLKDMGSQIPELFRYVSVYNEDLMENKNAFTLMPKKDNMVVTFDSILTNTDLAKKLKRMLDVLSEKMKTPVDIEFAHDGKHLYLLQCRPQGRGTQNRPAPIPQNLNANDILFTANRFISDGLLSGLTHIVYVDSDGYNALGTKEELLAVGTAVGLLNDILPRRKYILIGPGRWGSRGDIKLGVHVTYSDISGTAALIEVAKQKQSYVPEVSFGTHFFQDLVEADITYIPLYPDQPDVLFKESFFRNSVNILGKILPQYEFLSDVLKVIDIPACCQNQTLSIHMNAELEKAVAFFNDSSNTEPVQLNPKEPELFSWQMTDNNDHWQWRYYMAKQIAESINTTKFGVKGIYLFGSTNTGDSGMGSDIDLLFHVDGIEEKSKLLADWLDGWSRALAKINFLHTGYDTDKLLDFHIVTDQDIEEGNSFALKIKSVTDPAERLL